MAIKCYMCSRNIKSKQKTVKVAIHHIAYTIHATCFKILFNTEEYIEAFGVYVPKRSTDK